MISKELWLEVIKPIEDNNIYKKGVIEDFKIENNTLFATIFYESKKVDCKGTGLHSPKNINIHELSHKCKEWAFDKGFAFVIEYIGKKDINIQLINCHNEKTEYSKDFYNIENIEHIIIPCEWILKEINK